MTHTAHSKGKGIALITGASAGIGAEFARQLAAQGSDLVLVARRRSRLDDLAAELQRAHGVQVEVLPADLGEPAGLDRVAARLDADPAVTLLVNNAGFGVQGSFAEVDAGKHCQMVAVHVQASLRLAHAALPGMIARRAGGIINVASVAAIFPLPGSATYSATKAALVTFSEVLAMETSRHGLRVQALCPGFTYTEFHETPEYTGWQRSQIPRLLWCKVEDVVAESLRSLGRGPVVCVPGWQYRLGIALARSPLRGLMLRLVARFLNREREAATPLHQAPG